MMRVWRGRGGGKRKRVEQEQNGEADDKTGGDGRAGRAVGNVMSGERGAGVACRSVRGWVRRCSVALDRAIGAGVAARDDDAAAPGSIADDLLA